MVSLEIFTMISSNKRMQEFDGRIYLSNMVGGNWPRFEKIFAFGTEKRKQKDEVDKEIFTAILGYCLSSSLIQNTCYNLM